MQPHALTSLAAASARLLQDTSYAPSSTDSAASPLDGTASTSSDTMHIRVAAVFAVLAGGLLGGLPTLWMEVRVTAPFTTPHSPRLPPLAHTLATVTLPLQGFRDRNNNVTLLVRALSAGIIVALAFVHIAPDAINDWNSAFWLRPLPGSLPS